MNRVCDVPIVQEREERGTYKTPTLAGDRGGSTLMRSYKVDLLQTPQSFQFHRQGVLPKKGKCPGQYQIEFVTGASQKMCL